MMPIRANIVGPPSVANRGFHCCLPLRGLMLYLRKPRDVVAGILQLDKLTPARQRYRIFKRSFPAAMGFH